MPEVNLQVLLDALDRLPTQFTDLKNDFHEIPHMVAILNDFFNELVEGTKDPQYHLGNLIPLLGTLEADPRRTLLIIIGLLADPEVFKMILNQISFESYPLGLPQPMYRLVKALGKLVPPETLLRDDERQEELVRKVCRELNLSITGETPEHSQARLLQIDSEEIDKIQQEVQAKIQAALEEARRRAAAAKVSRE